MNQRGLFQGGMQHRALHTTLKCTPFSDILCDFCILKFLRSRSKRVNKAKKIDVPNSNCFGEEKLREATNYCLWKPDSRQKVPQLTFLKSSPKAWRMSLDEKSLRQIA